MKPTPPSKPGKEATKKALQAYASELRRYHRKLEELDSKLQKKQNDLKEFEDELIEDYEEELEELDCGCSIADAKAGCDCPDCDIWRDMEACRVRADKKEAKNDKGDEVKFLEGLFKLKDQR